MVQAGGLCGSCGAPGEGRLHGLSRGQGEADVQQEQVKDAALTLLLLKGMRILAQGPLGRLHSHSSSSLLLVQGVSRAQQTSLLFFSQPCLLLLPAADLPSSTCANKILFFPPKHYRLQNLSFDST